MRFFLVGLLALCSPLFAARSGNPCAQWISKLGYGLAVEVRRPGQPAKSYWVTNRGLKNLRAIVRGEGQLLNPNPAPRALYFLSLPFLRGKRVLDAGTGKGALVEDLVAFGIDATGLDIKLTDAQKRKRYFVEGDMAKLEFPDASFDVAFSSYAVFHYGEDVEIVRQALHELKRVTAPGGHVILFGNNRIRPWDTRFTDDFAGLELVTAFGDLEIFRRI